MGFVEGLQKWNMTDKKRLTKTANSVCVTGNSQPCTLVIQTTRRMKMTIFLEAIAYGAIGAIVVLILQGLMNE